RILSARLATQTPQQRRDTLTAMVTATAAAVLAHPDPAALDPDLAFKDLGIDSLTALELRNTINQQTGLTLPATLALDHPSPAALAAYLADLLTDTAAPAVPAAEVSTPGDEPVDDRLAYLDQASFLALRAVHGSLLQVTWIYDRAVDLDGLRRFHRNLGSGLLGRRIERALLPFARDRWVLSPASADIDIAATPRSRADVTAWADERGRVPIDPEWGPGWHLGVLPLEGGGTAVSLVASHTLVDAMAFAHAITDAAEGRTHNLGYSTAGSRTRRQALREDLRQTVKDLPDVARALGAVARRARRDREELKSSIQAAPPSARTASGDPTVQLPALTGYVDLAEWDARAKSLGVASNSLAAGIVCRLAVRAGRVRDDGTVTLRFMLSLRTANDTRANALTNVDVTVDPTHAATDLREMQLKITRAILAAMEDSNDDFAAPLPLAAMTPKLVARKLAGMAVGGGSLPVTCSNLGDLPPAANRPDGTDAVYLYMRSIEPDIKKSTLEAMGGQLFLASGRGHGKIFFRVVGYLPGKPNTIDWLREIVSRTFAEFDLTAEID
ncbi:fatty acyl-AMP ligase, partial [Mycobacterium simiae]